MGLGLHGGAWGWELGGGLCWGALVGQRSWRWVWSAEGGVGCAAWVPPRASPSAEEAAPCSGEERTAHGGWLWWQHMLQCSLGVGSLSHGAPPPQLGGSGLAGAWEAGGCPPPPTPILFPAEQWCRCLSDPHQAGGVGHTELPRPQGLVPGQPLGRSVQCPASGSQPTWNS